LFKGYGAKVGLGNMRVKAENRMLTSNGTSLWKQYNARNPDNIIRPFLEIVIDIQQYKTKVDEYFLVSDNLFK